MQKLRYFLERFGPVISRVLLAQVFIVSGIGKIKGYTATAAFMGNLGIPFPQFMLVLTIALEIGGGILLILGWRARWVALAFFGFTFLTAIVVHPFWNYELANMGGQLNNFMKNLAIMGGMLYVVIHGPGPFSLGRDDWDAAVPERKAKH